jgi:hypothetical protein
LLTRHDDAVSVLRDRRFSVQHRDYIDERNSAFVGWRVRTSS